ncbi:MAG: replication protein RepA [Candidatus Aenigmarchaeota archaeon]|nr:replication protein RepA [Candidatus Aenigmarchaeota archaeon]
MDSFQFKRAPAVPRKISDIAPDKDIRVRLLGRVIDKGEGSVVIDDGSAKAEIITEQPAELGDVVRIIARVLPLETGYDLRAEVTQDMSTLDMELYKKAAGNA